MSIDTMNPAHQPPRPWRRVATYNVEPMQVDPRFLEFVQRCKDVPACIDGEDKADLRFAIA